jgi:hypothetical protein
MKTNNSIDHQEADQRVVRELLNMIPDDWWSIALEVSTKHKLEPNELGLSIFRDEGEANNAMPTTELYEAVLKHFDLFMSNGTPWSKLLVRANYDDQIEQWRFTLSYEYQ